MPPLRKVSAFFERVMGSPSLRKAGGTIASRGIFWHRRIPHRIRQRCRKQTDAMPEQSCAGQIGPLRSLQSLISHQGETHDEVSSTIEL